MQIAVDVVSCWFGNLVWFLISAFCIPQAFSITLQYSIDFFHKLTASISIPNRQIPSMLRIFSLARSTLLCEEIRFQTIGVAAVPTSSCHTLHWMFSTQAPAFLLTYKWPQRKAIEWTIGGCPKRLTLCSVPENSLTDPLNFTYIGLKPVRA